MDSIKTWPIWVIATLIIGTTAGIIVFMAYETGKQVSTVSKAQGATGPNAAPLAPVPALDASRRQSAENIAQFQRQLQSARIAAAIKPRRRPSNGPQEPAISEALATQALAFVGVNADANSVWETAIDDATLSAEARRKLIAGLTTEGFDPANLTSADLPLLNARLTLIEQIAPDAIDESNEVALEAAYDRLQEMYDSVEQK
ncbi:MAG TPA: hypothetical protein VH370_16035 [Humisphaera sp.]|jgi:hypothetical protein|nr:hypothetical protein [Humisphaera sp.]